MAANVEYRKALVTFIDVLGFRDLVSTKSPAEVRKIVRLVQNFGAQDKTDNDDKKHENWTRTFAFSDSIIRIRPFDSDYRDGSLFHEIIALVHAQAELADLGVFVRGGMSAGDVYFEKNAIFGPAFVRAYELESQFANVPRIVIDPFVFEELRTSPRLRADHHDLADEIHYLKKLLAPSDDGLWFVDYLVAIQTELDEPEYYFDFLTHHRDFIISNADGLSQQSRAVQKYLWLATYHNNAVNRISNGDPRPELLIARENISMLELMPEVSKNIRD
jgi:hypothetical protein